MFKRDHFEMVCAIKEENWFKEEYVTYSQHVNDDKNLDLKKILVSVYDCTWFLKWCICIVLCSFVLFNDCNL